MIRRPPRSTPLYSSAASDVYKRQLLAEQPVHQRSVLPGPLVLGKAPLKSPAPTTDKTELSHDVLNPARVPLSPANSRTLGTSYSPRMGRGDIEVPDTAVDVNSWAVLACYPRGSFYPISHGPSTRYRRITLPDFRLCSTCRSHSQAPLCLSLIHISEPTRPY